ncbi:LacI family DNA-binding transcriptional regulator [Saccharothrix syringae]|uniref:LacI family transcriptional regulator n=1 Tax=Saccharothrix syringae TaxID=103733 RepID=A0A5Q0GZ53_SACSY|nr:LacI family DNA-binding transcriptional regulator [Saccharothrix syringae]QFZ19133.1 LacI family transcriptional regulator [Saccharothrix syringae]
MVTIAEVARHAGVAVSTVSYALSGKRSISVGTRRRIEASVRALGYQPRRQAHGALLHLALPGHGALGAEWLGSFLGAATASAHARGADLLVSPSAHHRGAAGVVVVAPASPPLDTSVPVVLVGGDGPVSRHSRVDLDRVAAGARAAEYLADLGHRAVAFVQDGPPDDFHHGFARGARERNASVRVHRAVEADRVFALDRPTAVVASDDAALTAVLADLQRRQLRVPEDVSVLALCSDGAARHGRWPVTSVSVSPAALGRAAVEVALDARPTTRLLPPRLTVRASTAPVRGTG